MTTAPLLEAQAKKLLACERVNLAEAAELLEEAQLAIAKRKRSGHDYANHALNGNDASKNALGELLENVVSSVVEGEGGVAGYAALYSLVKRVPHVFSNKHYARLRDAIAKRLTAERDSDARQALASCYVLLPRILGTLKCRENTDALLRTHVSSMTLPRDDVDDDTGSSFLLACLVLKSMLEEEVVREFPMVEVAACAMAEVRTASAVTDESIPLCLELLALIFRVFGRLALPLVTGTCETVESAWRRLERHPYPSLEPLILRLASAVTMYAGAGHDRLLRPLLRAVSFVVSEATEASSLARDRAGALICLTALLTTAPMPRALDDVAELHEFFGRLLVSYEAHVGGGGARADGPRFDVREEREVVRALNAFVSLGWVGSRDESFVSRCAGVFSTVSRRGGGSADFHLLAGAKRALTDLNHVAFVSEHRQLDFVMMSGSSSFSSNLLGNGGQIDDGRRSFGRDDDDNNNSNKDDVADREKDAVEESRETKRPRTASLIETTNTTTSEMHNKINAPNRQSQPPPQQQPRRAAVVVVAKAASSASAKVMNANDDDDDDDIPDIIG